MCSKALLALLVYGIIMHCSVYCSPAAGLQYPPLRLEDEVYDEDGKTLQDFAYDHEPLGIANPSSVIGEMYTWYYPPEKRHADGIFSKAYRKLLGQLSARKYLHSLMAKRVGNVSADRNLSKPFRDQWSCWRWSGASVTAQEGKFPLPCFINKASSNFCVINTHS
ncbi:pituitary adenylate cyclase-activating polypeptide isoform X2 [Pogoniulus pusillus]|uniref:pituitary adenylate cyclase-activating polypeptide isoform X2 n=1 Tax=Pogoniulus pusillus TaxID=488313 RepID=UPI0030B95E02